MRKNKKHLKVTQYPVISTAGKRQKNSVTGEDFIWEELVEDVELEKARREGM